MKNSKQKYDFGHLMNERLSDDKFKSIFKPERIKVASLDSPPNSMMEIVALSEELEKLQLSKYASVMLKVAEGMDDPEFKEPEINEPVEDTEQHPTEENHSKFDKPADYEECGICGYDHEYDLINELTFRKASGKHVEKGSLPPEFADRLTRNTEGV
jgi:hypothetical protein